MVIYPGLLALLGIATLTISFIRRRSHTARRCEYCQNQQVEVERPVL